jgi:hypothetical protein
VTPAADHLQKSGRRLRGDLSPCSFEEDGVMLASDDAGLLIETRGAVVLTEPQLRGLVLRLTAAQVDWGQR